MDSKENSCNEIKKGTIDLKNVAGTHGTRLLLCVKFAFLISYQLLTKHPRSQVFNGTSSHRINVLKFWNGGHGDTKGC